MSPMSSTSAPFPTRLTTIAALRTAVIVAQALSNQKLVLDQIDALNTTTSSLIESTHASPADGRSS